MFHLYSCYILLFPVFGVPSKVSLLWVPASPSKAKAGTGKLSKESFEIRGPFFGGVRLYIWAPPFGDIGMKVEGSGGRGWSRHLSIASNLYRSVINVDIQNTE